MTAVHDFQEYDNHVKFARFVWLAVGEEAKQSLGLQVNVHCRDFLDLGYSGYHHKNLIQ